MRIHPARRDETILELQYLYALVAYQQRWWSREQFQAIVAACECIYSRREDPVVDARTRCPLRRDFRGRSFQVTVPLRFFFRGTIATESFFASPDFSDVATPVETLRQRWTRLIIPGPSGSGAVVALGRIWTMPEGSTCSKPMLDHITGIITAATPLQHPRSNKDTFQRIWTAAGNISGPAPRAMVACRHNGTSWALHVPKESALDAQLELETMVLEAADSGQFQSAWESLKRRYPLRQVPEVPTENLFRPTAATYCTAPAAKAPRFYRSDCTTPSRATSSALGAHFRTCRLCLWKQQERDDASWHAHLHTHGGPKAYREQVLAAEAHQWPTPVDQCIARESAASYAMEFWRRMASPCGACSVCALPRTAVELSCVDLRKPPFDVGKLHTLFSGPAYLESHATLYPDPSPASFIGLPFQALQATYVAAPAEVSQPGHDVWLLFFPQPKDRSDWLATAADTSLPLECTLCTQCLEALQGAQPRLHGRALANGNLCLPFPDALAGLTFAECLFIARGFTLKRLHSLPGPSAPADRQQGLRGNVISFPQNAASIVDTLPRHPDQAAELLTVFFPAEDNLAALHCKPYIVRRQHVHAALVWLQRHNPWYADIRIDDVALEALPDDGVPSQFRFFSTLGHCIGAQVGPADAQVSETAAASAEMPLAAAVLDVEGEGLAPLHLCGTAQGEGIPEYDVLVPHGEQPLSSFAKEYWTLCFPHLFPYGDGLVGGARRTRFPDKLWVRHLLLRVDRNQAQQPWSLDVDFIATAFSVLHRRELLQAVHVRISSPNFAHYRQLLARLRDVDFQELSLLLQDAGGLCEALSPLAALNCGHRVVLRCCRLSLNPVGHPHVSDDMKQILRSMEIVAGAVPCTEASRRRMRQHLRSLQLWQGLPSIFLTLNPADTKHPFTLYYASAPASPWTPCGSDAALEAALQNVNLLHAVASDPVAVARAFHQHVQLLLQHLLGCSLPSSSLASDGVASAGPGGIVGPVSAYFGVTEPQLRGSLHLHMLVHTYPFSTPAAFVDKLEGALPEFTSRLLAWTNTCLSTSLEALPALWELEKPAAELFANLQALPYSMKQQQRLGEQLAQSWDFARASSQWYFGDATRAFTPVAPWSDPLRDAAEERRSFLPWPRNYMANPAYLDVESLVPMLLYDLRHSVVQCCLHDCRPRTCHKGFLGKCGFCRLGYWHWQPLQDSDPETWQRCHGLPLSSQSYVGRTPPHVGLLLTERHHPYHTRFNSFLLATAKCNHDVSILVRAPGDATATDAATFVSMMAASTQLASYYITSYISKVQPQLVGLWSLLREAQSQLQVELSQHADAVTQAEPYVASRVLTRMLTASHRRVHKSLPEICHYLLGYPEAYVSHSFRPPVANKELYSSLVFN